jgi:hypothetical protein
MPDIALIGGAWRDGPSPDNDVAGDGFALWLLDSVKLGAIRSQAEQGDATMAWIEKKVAGGKMIAGMSIGCNYYPLVLVWELQRSGHWLIAGFAVVGI